MRRRNLFKTKNNNKDPHFNMVPVFSNNRHDNYNRQPPQTVAMQHLLKKIPSKQSRVEEPTVTIVEGDVSTNQAVVNKIFNKDASMAAQASSMIHSDVDGDISDVRYSDLESISSEMATALFANFDDRVICVNIFFNFKFKLGVISNKSIDICYELTI